MTRKLSRNPFLLPIAVAAVTSVILISSLKGESYENHGIQRLIDRVIYKEDGEYKGSIPRMQSMSESGFKVAGICKLASTTTSAIYKRDLNGVAEYYSDLFGGVYSMALNNDLSVAAGAKGLYEKGHADQTSKWAGQRMSIIRSTMSLIHGDLGMEGPEGMPDFEVNPENAALTREEFVNFMIDVKEKAESSDSLTTNMAAALASSPSQLNGLVDKASFLIKDKIAGLLADPAGNDSEVPVEMRTADDVFNPQNVGDLFHALGVHALHIQNPDALARAGVRPSANVLAALNRAKAQFSSDDRAINAAIAGATQGTPKWDSAPLGPFKAS